MSSRRRLFVVLGLGSIFGVASLVLWLWNRHQDVRAYEVQVVAELAANRKLGAALQASRSSLAGQSRSGASAPSKVAAATPTPASGQPTRPTAANIDRGRRIRDALERMPEYAPFLRAELRRRTMRDYGEWFAQLNVSPERLEIVKGLIAHKIGTREDAFSAALATGYRMGTREFEEIMARHSKEPDERLQRELTPDEYTSYRTFEAARSWTTVVLPQIEDYFGDRGVPPLTPAQRRAFSEAYLAVREWNPAEETPAPAVLYRMRNARIGVLAGAALEPAQREALAGYFAFINRQSEVLGRLLNPNAPDAAVISHGIGSRP